MLLDFWTYCCINCIHVLPDLARLERDHGDALVVIGVHSAKFDNERDADMLRQAVLRYDIEHPVVSDPHRRLWSEYTIQSWPSFVLVDPQGYVIGQLSGEGQYEVLDQVIREQTARFTELGLLELGRLRFRREKDRPGGARALSFPGRVLADEAGSRLVVADSGNHRIVVAGLDGAVEAVIGDGQAGRTDGTYAEARFDNPQGMALADGTLYVADTGNHLIRAIDLARKTVSTVVGSGTQAAGPSEPGTLREVALSSPWGRDRRRPAGCGRGTGGTVPVRRHGGHPSGLGDRSAEGQRLPVRRQRR